MLDKISHSKSIPGDETQTSNINQLCQIWTNINLAKLFFLTSNPVQANPTLPNQNKP